MPARPTPLLEIVSSDPFMTEEEKQILQKKKEALDKFLSQEGLAKYKIEIMFSKGFAPSKPSAGGMSFWESGSKFHGGGDTVMHICPDEVVNKKTGKNGCGALIPDASHGYGFLVCPKCHNLWDGEEVHGQILARLDAYGWTRLTLKYFYKMEMNADIYVKHHPDDVRNIASKEQERQLMGTELNMIRSRRVPRIYPLRNIIKDISAGAELEGRILAFLRS